MLEFKTKYDIFDLPQKGEAVCVTTNGVVKSNGQAVMGAGIAKQADQLFNLSTQLGKYLNQYGNRAFNMGVFQANRIGCCVNFFILTLPTKHDWRNGSDINLIIQSCNQLVEMCNKFGINKCYLTPPGCGCGKLNWLEVKPIIAQILDNRFVVVVRD